ncbi:unnamed protein product [Zymoseptoria tritici ST99CH_1A5]|uniref:Uncharacterized protein n=1 Tax=Zymoseptoria tritici ST99CH_1A5 TaxID=1276529 RepID=A0A1Y6LP62_ZYMTR|nr:unnamed protein product [Zymoseptoria tritici ST99CH_1A5]
MGARSREKAEAAIASIKVQAPTADITHLPMDLSDLSSVKQAAETFLATSTRLDILMNNAGIMGCPPALTKDGFEVQLGTNHVGHALLTKLLLPILQKTAQSAEDGGKPSDVRIVNVSSAAHLMAPKQGLVLEAALTPMSDYQCMVRYGQSKLANIYFTQELAKRYPSIRSISLHPGVVKTNLLQSGIKESYSWVPKVVWSLVARLTSVSRANGTLNQLWASCSKDAKSGEYYDPVGKVGKKAAVVKDESKAAMLWEWTEEQLSKRGF